MIKDKLMKKINVYLLLALPILGWLLDDYMLVLLSIALMLWYNICVRS